jgi:Holliday junction resolvase-like predicted endonuclease
MLPIGIQAFEKLRNASAVYVDKTQHIWNLVNCGSVYFLSRPRRFGKSLLVSCLSELLAGNKQLFDGLYIYDKWEWEKTFPVIHLDFTEIQYATVEQLEISLDKFLNDLAKKENIELEKSSTVLIGVKFAELIEKLHEKTGNPVAILIDEYDKPLIDNLGDKETHEKVKRTLHDFYQVIKAKDKHIKFMFMTGVSRFSGLSVFSALNNLNDITMDTQYASICGYTQEELEANFKEHIEEAGKYLGISYDKTIDAIKRWYNGYSWDGKTFVYNPFSTLLLFKKKEFDSHWYETGTPTFLIEQIKKKNGLYSFVATQEVESNTLKGNGDDNQEIATLLFQTGYLTIKKKELREDKTSQYAIDFPNMEVKKAFLSSLLVAYANKESHVIEDIGKKVRKAIEEKDSEGLKRSLVELLANVPYDLITKKESFYHAVFLIEARLSGFEVQGEVHTDKGRIDAVLKKDNSVIVVEIKYSKEKPTDKMIEDALAQIRDRKYFEKYIGNDVSLLAIAFGNKKEIACRFEKL